MSAVQAARVREWEVTYEKGQQTIDAKRCDAAWRCYDEWREWVWYSRRRVPTLQRNAEENETFDDEGWEPGWRTPVTTARLDADRQLREIGGVVQWRHLR